MAFGPVILVPQLNSPPHPDPDIVVVVPHLPRMSSSSTDFSGGSGNHRARKRRKGSEGLTTGTNSAVANLSSCGAAAAANGVMYCYECYPYNHEHPLFYNSQDKHMSLDDPNRVIPKPQHNNSSKTNSNGNNNDLEISPSPLPPVLFSGNVKASKFFRLFFDPSPPPLVADQESGYRLQLQNRDFNCWHVQDVFTGDEFKVVAQAVEDLLHKPSRSLVDADEDPAQSSKSRNSISKPLDNKQFVHFLRRLSLLTGVAPSHFEPLQIVGYTDKTMHYGMHHDSASYRPNPSMSKHGENRQILRWMEPLLDIEAHHLAQRLPIKLPYDENVKRAGEGRLRTRTENVVAGEPFRIMTMLVYINGLTNKEGGETAFPWAVLGPEEVHNDGRPVKFGRAQGARFRPTTNSGVLWSNITTNEEGQVVLDPRVIHSAERVTGGTMKFAVNVWGCNKVVDETTLHVADDSDFPFLPSTASSSHDTKGGSRSGSSGSSKYKTSIETQQTSSKQGDTPLQNNSIIRARERVMTLARVQRAQTEDDLFCETCGGGLEGFDVNRKEGRSSVKVGFSERHHLVVEKTEGYFVYQIASPVKEQKPPTKQLVMCEARKNRRWCKAAAVCLPCFNELWAKKGPYQTCADYAKSEEKWFCHQHRQSDPANTPPHETATATRGIQKDGEKQEAAGNGVYVEIVLNEEI
eukprot:GHVS01091032.1.p1 GENE.GHVS01091032.1~~GHVS01091032.1.p1  ORF type:complete len:690 (+),score=125.88 GHVS01091032.1:460-2529(+)